jgi:hypothetical protein
MSKKSINGILYILSIGIVVFIFYRLYQYLDYSIIAIILKNPVILIFILLIITTFYFLQAFLWSFIVITFHKNMDLLTLMTIRSQGEFGKYLPGKVWNLVFISYSAKKNLNLRISKSVSASFIELYLTILVLGSFILFYYKFYLFIVLLLFTLPILGYIFKNYRVFIIGFLMSAIAWSCILYAFFILVQFSEISLSFVQASGLFSMGQLGGMIAFFIPAGLGVKEYLVVSLSGNQNLTNSVILFRVLFIFSEIFRYLIFMLLRRYHAG